MRIVKKEEKRTEVKNAVRKLKDVQEFSPNDRRNFVESHYKNINLMNFLGIACILLEAPVAIYSLYNSFFSKWNYSNAAVASASIAVFTLATVYLVNKYDARISYLEDLPTFSSTKENLKNGKMTEDSENYNLEQLIRRFPK